MKQPPIPAQHETDAFVASCFALIGWLFQLIATLGAPHRSERLRRAIERAERSVEALIFVRAMARIAPIPRAPRHPHTILNTPPGFRRGRRKKRLFFRYARIAQRNASFAQRIGRLMSVLANPELYIARFVALILQGLRPGALIAVAPPACAWRDASARAVAFADSS